MRLLIAILVVLSSAPMSLISLAEELRAEDVLTVTVAPQGGICTVHLHESQPTAIFFEDAIKWTNSNERLAVYGDDNRLVLRAAPRARLGLDGPDATLHVTVGRKNVTILVVIVASIKDAQQHVNVIFRDIPSARSRPSQGTNGVALAFVNAEAPASDVCVRAHYRPSNTPVMHCTLDVNACELERRRMVRDRQHYHFVTACEPPSGEPWSGVHYLKRLFSGSVL
ncbi:hypothetical protein [Haliangium sp.]|uniref:hypothetical protein n=1 Tax=Haliangium sp. TaxID=2663208 RepID=UPI003D124654